MSYQLDSGTPLDISQRRISGNVSARTEWRKWLHTSVATSISTLQQISAAADHLPVLTVYTPHLEVDLRAEALTLSVTSGLQLSGQTQSLSRLDASLTYAPTGSNFQWFLQGVDLLNYQRSTFREVIATAAEVREIFYQRLPGYIEVGGKWTGKR